ncbi:MAG: tetratricopeptide repeat protein, partial [Quisquiliibacterium sp.]
MILRFGFLLRRAMAGGGMLMSIMLLVVAVSAGCAGPSGQADKASAQRPVLPDSPEESETRRRARISVELAANYYQQGNYTVALQELRQAVVIDPEYSVAHGMLGLVYMDLGDRAQAESSFRQGLALRPDDSELNNNFGWFLCQTGRPKDSIEFFMRALKNPLYPTP